MKNNEPLNSSDISDHLSDNGMSAEEYRLYKEILDAAYPHPNRDIRAGVMEAIRNEKDAVGSAVITPKKKSSLRTSIVKWGSLAASIAIVALVGVKVLPAFLSGDDVALENEKQDAIMYSTTSDKTVSESALDSDGAIPVTASTFTAIVDEAISEEAIEEEFDYSSAAETAPETGSHKFATEAEAPEAYSIDLDETEAVRDESAKQSADSANSVSAVYGDASENAASNSIVTAVIVCNHTEVFNDSYHEIPDYLIDEVGREEFYDWANAVSLDDSCAVNIASFIEYFEISESTFGMYLSTTDIAYYCDYPLDILYCGDSGKIEEYYAGGGRYEDMVKDYFEYELKQALASEIGTEAYTAWLDEIGCDASGETVRGWSISQMVRDNTISTDKFIEIYEETVEAFPEEYDGYELQEYNITALYVNTSKVQIALAMSSDGYAADVACRK